MSELPPSQEDPNSGTLPNEGQVGQMGPESQRVRVGPRGRGRKSGESL